MDRNEKIKLLKGILSGKRSISEITFVHKVHFWVREGPFLVNKKTGEKTSEKELRDLPYKNGLSTHNVIFENYRQQD